MNGGSIYCATDRGFSKNLRRKVDDNIIPISNHCLGTLWSYAVLTARARRIAIKGLERNRATVQKDVSPPSLPFPLLLSGRAHPDPPLFSCHRFTTKSSSRSGKNSGVGILLVGAVGGVFDGAHARIDAPDGAAMLWGGHSNRRVRGWRPLRQSRWRTIGGTPSGIDASKVGGRLVKAGERPSVARLWD
jgi:hypothetical protein